MTYWGAWRVILFIIITLVGLYFYFFPIEERKEPLIAIKEGPRFTELGNDTSCAAFSLLNYGNGTAINLIDSEFEIIKRDTGFTIVNKWGRTLREGYEIQSGAALSYYIHMIRAKMIPNANEYYFFKLKYTDKKGKTMEPVKEIFDIPYPSPSAMIYNIIPERQAEVKVFLKSNSLW